MTGGHCISTFLWIRIKGLIHYDFHWLSCALCRLAAQFAYGAMTSRACVNIFPPLTIHKHCYVLKSYIPAIFMDDSREPVIWSFWRLTLVWRTDELVFISAFPCSFCGLSCSSFYLAASLAHSRKWHEVPILTILLSLIVVIVPIFITWGEAGLPSAVVILIIRCIARRNGHDKNSKQHWHMKHAVHVYNYHKDLGR